MTEESKKAMVLHCYDKIDEVWCKLESAKVDLVDMGFVSEPIELWNMQRRMTEIKSMLFERFEKYFD